MTNKFFNRSFNLAALMLALLFTGLYSCSERIASDETPIKTETNIAPALSVLKSASLLPDALISSVTLWAGQSMNAGTVKLYQTDINGDLTYDAIKVTYTLTGDWYFDTLVHFYIGTGPVPTNPGGNIAPGSFPIILTASTNPFSFTIPFTDFGFQGCTALPLNVAAHAELTSPTLGHQTGFGAGTVVGNSWFTAYTVTLTDKTPPTASDVTSSFECIGSVPAIDPLVITDAHDNCGNPTVTYVENSETSVGTCPTIITRNYLVADAAGNTKTVKHTITVDDNTPPVFDALPVIQAISCLDEDVFVTPTAKDNCDPNPVVTVTNKVVTATSKTRTWTATDACGNQSSVSATVSLDKTAPSFSGVVATGTVACEVTDVFSVTPSLFTTPLFSDNYDTNPTVVVTDKTEPVAGTSIVWYTRTWTATDKCGNSVAVSQKLVKDCSGFGGTGFPFDYTKGAGTGWAYDVASPSISKPFNLIPNKLSNNWGWTNGKISKGTTDKYFVLYVGAGQNSLTKGAPVGYVKVTYSGLTVNFTYWVIADCNITGVHFYAGATELPKNKKGQFISSPGQLGVSQTALSGSVTLPAGTTDIYVAAHANVVLK